MAKNKLFLVSAAIAYGFTHDDHLIFEAATLSDTSFEMSLSYVYKHIIVKRHSSLT